MKSKDGLWSAHIHQSGLHATLFQNGCRLGLQRTYSVEELTRLRNILFKGYDMMGERNGTPHVNSAFATRVESFNMVNGDFRLVKHFRYAAVELHCGNEILGLYSYGMELRDFAAFLKDVATEMIRIRRIAEEEVCKLHA